MRPTPETLHASERDRRAVEEALGKPPDIPFEVVARCPDGAPLVIRDAVRDPAGAPFPTRYWLACPEAVRSVSRLEAAGWIGRLNRRAESDPGFGAALSAAHAAYARERERAEPGAGAWGGVGGTRRGVKCLHAHLAYHLAGGADPVGAWTAERTDPWHPPPATPPAAAV
ncbi:MAG TPA: DUF501 domain-containing protein, partial [Actinomycetota bacterium]|nr:DUF501 domain-containing protein [Actinomycetota bacterium]